MDKGQDIEAPKNIKSPDRVKAEHLLDQYQFRMEQITDKDDANGKIINEKVVNSARQRLSKLPDGIISTILPTNETIEEITPGQRLGTYLDRLRDNGPWKLQEDDNSLNLSGKLIHLPQEIKSKTQNSQNGTAISIDESNKSWQITIPKPSHPSA